MIAWKYFGLEKMKFNLSGGKGSNGQDGGHGASCNESYVTAPTYRDGGDGGKGGDAGLGGKHGESFIYKTNEKKP